jgi:hypothetical protein
MNAQGSPSTRFPGAEPSCPSLDAVALRDIEGMPAGSTAVV